MPVLDRRTEELRKRTGMARWWEQDAHGYYFSVQCRCGGVVEAVFREEGLRTEALFRAERAAQDRFRQRFPDCPHLAQYNALIQDPVFVMDVASDLMSGIEESWNLYWGDR